MTNQPATHLPVTPEALADWILTHGDAGLLPAFTAQLGPRPARRLLAAAHSIAAHRLWNS